MLGQVASPAGEESLVASPVVPGERGLALWSGRLSLLAILLILIWLLVLFGLPAWLLPLAASCLTFLALLITPGFLLADMIAWRLRLDKFEQLALALPMGLAVLALPGMAALLFHRTLTELAAGWSVISALVVLAWLLARAGVPVLERLFRNQALWSRGSPIPWALDEILLLLFIIVLFAAIVPALSVPKIDGDAYAVNTFAMDALAGLPLNAREPLFGTDLGPGVRMAFNQSLPLSYLWSYLSGLDSISLISRYSRQILAFWSVLAMYMLGKAAGTGSRRFGLFTAAIQLLIYAAAPFWRGDNVSLYFFERINADKFMVVVLLLPPCFALAIRYVREGHLDIWLAAAVVAFAISTVHPLGAAMVALALSAFGALHLLLNLRYGLSWWRRLGPGARKAALLFQLRHRPAWQRSLGLFALVAVVMILPILQLVLSRGEAPLAPSYPKSFEGWSVGETSVPIFPFLQVRGLTLYGAVPELDQLKAQDANSPTNPFLVWRFAANMDRQRLIFFSVDRYVSDPRLLLELPYVLALLLLPLLLRRIRTDPAVQFVIGTTLAILFVMFSPILMPLIGSMVMPWILWRLVWLLPYPLILALVAWQLLVPRTDASEETQASAAASRHWLGVTIPRRASGLYALPALLLIVALLATPAIISHLRYLEEDASSSYFFPAPERIFARLNALTGPDHPATVLADQDLSVTVAAYVAGANILAHRVPTTSEIFPADLQNVALQRLIDQDRFFRAQYLTPETIDILRRNGVKYIVTSSGSELDMQLQLAPQWFQRLLDDHSYSLYAMLQMPSQTALAIQGNEAMAGRDWAGAEALYKSALGQDPGDLLALAGMAKIAAQRGQFDQAFSWWSLALAQADLPILHARLGELHALRGEIARSGAEWEQAALRAPDVARYHIGLGDACLRNGMEDCAAEQYTAAVDQRSLPDQASRLMMQANLWQAQGRYDKALPLYEQAVALQPLRFNQYILESAYREAGQLNQSRSLLQQLRLRNPFSAELATVDASLLAREGRRDEAARLYRRAIFLEGLEAQDTVDTRLRLTQLLLNAGHLQQAGREIEKTLSLAPFNGEAHRLQGDLFRLQGKYEEARQAYGQAFVLQPDRVDIYISLNNLLRQQGARPADWLRILQIAIRTNPDEPSLYIAMGDYWQGQGNGEAAIDAYLSALEKLDADASSNPFLSPSTRQGRAFLYSRLAQIYEDQAQPTVAASYYQAMAVMASEVPWTQIVLGDARRRQNDLVAAETLYRKALENDPGYLIAYLRLAEIQERRGEEADAASLRQMTMQLAEAQLMQSSSNEDLAGSQQPLSWRNIPLFSDGAAPTSSSGDGNRLLAHIQASEEQVSTLGLLTHLYQISGETDQAIELYQAALAQSEEHGGSPALRAQYHKGLGDLHLSQGQLDLAVEDYRQAILLDGWWSEARLGLATALTAQGHGDAAVKELQTAADLAPGLLEVRLALAEALVREGQPGEAQAIYEAAAQGHPGSTRLTEALAAFYAAHRQPRLALPLYQQALAHDPTNASLYLALSQLWLSQGDAAQAMSVLESGLEAASDPAELTTTLATLYIRQNEPEQALAVLGQGISRIGEKTELLLGMGAYYSSRANDDQAAEWIERAHTKDPGSPAVQTALADLATHRENPAEALSHYEQAVALAPGAPGYRLRLANAYQTSQRYEEAIAAYSHVLASQPDLPEAYTGLAEVLRTQQRWDEARLIYERGMAQAPTSGWLMSAYAGFLLERGDQAKALELIQRAAEQAQDVPTMVSLAALYDKIGQADKSENALKSALEQEPGSVLALTALGDLYEAQGRTAEAKTLYEKIVALAPGISTGYLRLGNLANAAGDQAAADQYAALAQKVAPEAFGP